MARSNKNSITGNESSADTSESASLKTICLSKKNNGGFTLIEIVYVLAIVVILVIIASSSFSNFKDNARIARAAAEIRGIEKEISAYALEKGGYPASLADVGGGDHLDPWGHPYVYKTFVDGEMRFKAADQLNTDYDLYSKGKDNNTTLSIGVAAIESADDIFRARDGSFVGTPKQYQ